MMKFVGNAVRELGQALDRAGCRIQGNSAFQQQLSRHRRLVSLEDKEPVIAKDVWIAPSASVVGNVKVGEGSSIWYGCVLRGDVNTVTVGEKTSIGDRVIVHCSETNPKGPAPTRIGSRVVIGEGALLHACTVQDGAVVDMGAVVMDRAIVESGAVVGPGAIVTEGKVVKSGQLWLGNPAKHARDVTPEEVKRAATEVEERYKLSKLHQLESVKNAKYEADMNEFVNTSEYYAGYGNY